MNFAALRMRWLGWALATLIISGNGQATELKTPLALPEFTKESLLNGLEFLVLPSSADRAPFLLMIRNGAAFDPVDKWGVTLLMARMMLDRTRKHTREQLEFELKNLEASIEIRVDYDAIYFLGSAPVRKIGEVLDLLGDIVSRPQFNQDRFEVLRDQLLDERISEAGSPEQWTQDLLDARVFGANPYGHAIKGNPETLKNINLADIKIQYRRLVLPNQSQLAFYNSVEKEPLFRSLSRSWGAWVRRTPVPFTFRRAPATKGGRIWVKESDAQASLLRWARLGVERTDSAYYALRIFEQYLLLSLPNLAGKGDSAGQIRALPEVQARRMPGNIQLSIQAAPHELVAYYGRFQDLLGRLRSGKIDPERYEESKQLVFMDFKEALQSPQGRLRILLEMNLYNIGAGYVTTFGLRLSRIDSNRFQKVLADYLAAEDFHMVVAGPVGELKGKLQRWGAVSVLNQ